MTTATLEDMARRAADNTSEALSTLLRRQVTIEFEEVGIKKVDDLCPLLAPEEVVATVLMPVTGDAEGAAAQSGDLLGCGAGGLLVDVADDHVGAALREAQGDGAPDAAPRPGDDGDLILQVLGHARPPLNASPPVAARRAGGVQRLVPRGGFEPPLP